MDMRVSVWCAFFFGVFASLALPVAQSRQSKFVKKHMSSTEGQNTFCRLVVFCPESLLLLLSIVHEI